MGTTPEWGGRRIEGDLRAPWRWFLVAGTLLPILFATLVPSGEESVVTPFLFCVICGGVGSASLVRNVMLFVPFGVALALLLGPRHLVLLVVLLTTVSIETLQFRIPGRNPMVADVAANFIGGVLGLLAVRLVPWWLTPGKGRSAALSLASAGLAAAVIFGTAASYSRDLPESMWWGQWTPNLGHFERYEGRVLRAVVDGRAVGSGQIEDSGELRRTILAGASINVTAVAGPPTSGLAPVFSIYDERRREVLLLGVDGTDLVGRNRFRANRWRFDRPDVRIRNALSNVTPGDTIHLEYALGGGGSCLGMDGFRECGLGPRIEEGWALLLFPSAAPFWLRRALDFAWMVALVLPFGYFLRHHPYSFLGGAVLLGAVTSPLWLTEVAGPKGISFFGAATGVALGVWLALRARFIWGKSPGGFM